MQVSGAPEFLAFCVDLIDPIICCEAYGGISQKKGFTAQFMIATVDAAFYVQNAVIAANCLVLGICYIGTLRNKLDETSALLRLPENVCSVFGLCIGYPAEGPDLKSRIPAGLILK